MPRASTSPRWASKAASSWLERPTRPRVAVSSSASDSSAGDWLGLEGEESEMAESVLELMRCRLHLDFLRPVFARSRAITGEHETRVDRMSERPSLDRVQART